MASNLDLTADEANLKTIIESVKKNYKKSANNEHNKVLFQDLEDDREKLFITVALCKIPEIPENGKQQPMSLKTLLPHRYSDKLDNVLLVTKDQIIKTRKKVKTTRDYERTLQHFKDLIRKHKANDLINEIIPLKQLSVQYPECEAKRVLSERFDIVLCDATVIGRVPKLLGKHFFKKNRNPIKVNLKDKKLKKALTNALSKSCIHMSLNGATASGPFGRMNQSNEDLLDNLKEVMKSIRQKLPGGWENLRSLHIGAKNVTAIPIYYNTVSPKSLPDVKHPNIKPLKSVTDVFTTAEMESDEDDQEMVVAIRGADVEMLPQKANMEKELDRRRRFQKAQKMSYNPETNKVGAPNFQRALKKFKRRGEKLGTFTKKAPAPPIAKNAPAPPIPAS